MICMVEIWKDIIGYEGLYKISNFGRIESNHHDKAIILKNSNNGHGYITYSLNLGNKITKTFYAHRLVAKHFLPVIEGKEFVNHKDGDKSNNVASNLEWCTRAENCTHAVATGLQTRIGANHSFSKVVLDTMTGIFYETMTEASKICGIKRTTLCAMLTGKNRNRTNLMYV